MQEVTITVTRILLNHRIDPYNTKLILLSCLKQTLTLTLGPVTPTETTTLEEMVEEVLAAEAEAVAEMIAERQSLNIHLKEK